MHILECRCGMIRSVSALVARSRCSRCGRLAATHLWRLEETADETGLSHGSALSLVRVPLSEAYTESSHPSLVDYLMTLVTDEDHRQTRVDVPWDLASAREIIDWLDQQHRCGHLNKARHDFEVGRVIGIVKCQLRGCANAE